MWAWMEEAAERWPKKPSLPPQPPRVIKTIERWLTLRAPSPSVQLPCSHSPTVTLTPTAVDAESTGRRVGGRWAVAGFYQAGRQSSGLPALFHFPPWMKWVNLALLVIGAATVLLSDPS